MSSVYARRGRLGFLSNPLRLALRRQFTRGFMASEFETLAGIRYNPAGLLECDAPMIEFYRWLAQLPQTCAVDWAASVPCPESQPLCKASAS